jgi:hypothetical protein
VDQLDSGPDRLLEVQAPVEDARRVGVGDALTQDQ